MLARSRLTQPLVTNQLQTPQLPNATLHQNALLAVTKKYTRHSFLLLLGVVSYASVAYILTAVSPEKIAHIPLPHTYFLLQLPLILGNLFFFSFLLLNTRRGALTALGIALVLFLKLQLVVLTVPVVLSILGLLVLIEVGASLAKQPKKK